MPLKNVLCKPFSSASTKSSNYLCLLKCDSVGGVHLIELWMYASEMVTLNSPHTEEKDISGSDSSDLF